MARTLRPIDVYPITTRTLQVLRVQDVTPGMRRVTLGGPELAAHTAANGYSVAAFRSDGFDDEGKLILKHPDAEVAVGPTQADGVLDWPRTHEHALHRTYSVRRWDPAAGEFDLDFVKHGVGPATSWAYSVQPGETVQWAGPKMSGEHPEGVDWTLVAGDETALPAIGRWLETWPEGARGQVFVEVAEASHRQLDLPVPDGVELTWLTRDGAEPGTTTLLHDAIRAADWWDGKVFAWVAGETLTLTPIRRWLRTEKGLAKEQVEVTGYWRRREVVVSDDSGVQDLEASEDEAEIFHELTELLPPFAVRVAASIDLGGALREDQRSLTALARATGANERGLGKLLRYLAALGIVAESEAGEFRLTTLGHVLSDERTVDSLHLERFAAQRELGGALALLAAVRSGSGDDDRWFGAPFTERVLSNRTLLAERTSTEADGAGFAAGGIARADVFRGMARVAVVGRGAGTVAVALCAAHPGLRAIIVGLPSELEAIRAVHGTSERVEYAAGTVLAPLGEPADALLLVRAFETLPDADAEHTLRQAAASVRPGGAVLVFGSVLDPRLAHEHTYESDVIDFALNGGGTRTHEEYSALFAAAGFAEPARSTIGWGETLYALAVPAPTA